MKLERNDWFFLGILLLFSVPSFLMDLTSDPGKAIMNFMSVIIMAFIWIFLVKLAWPWFSKKMELSSSQHEETQPTKKL